MPTGPDPAHADDPRLPELLAGALKACGVPRQLAEPVRRLVIGEVSPLEFPCCNTGCVPCNKSYLRAAEKVLVALADEPLAARAPSDVGSRRWWQRRRNA